MQNGTLEPGTAALGLVQLKQLVSRVQLKQLDTRSREGGPPARPTWGSRGRSVRFKRVRADGESG